MPSGVKYSHDSTSQAGVDYSALQKASSKADFLASLNDARIKALYSRLGGLIKDAGTRDAQVARLLVLEAEAAGNKQVGHGDTSCL